MNTVSFWITSLLFGVALAMDSFSVSVADGLANPHMTHFQKLFIPVNFGFFQCIMPIIGWFCVKTVADTFVQFQKFIPWIGFLLLLYIGSEMIMNRKRPIEAVQKDFFTPRTLIIQGIGTAIDALSVGFAVETYSLPEVLISSLIIGVTTFVICVIGIELGKMIGKHFYSSASVLGGIILIGIGIEILVKGLAGK